MKKIIAILLTAVMLVLVFSGCGGQGGVYFGDELSKESLRICVDSWRSDPVEEQRMKDAEAFFESLASELKVQCGIEKITFELLPQSSVKRSTKLQRLRTEIMAGEGPDLFIVQTTCNSMNSDLYKDALFNYPEKSMEVGLFLPLDEYMENSSRFTDWDAQTQAVLEAGRNREGQMLIPMVYHIPLLIYPAEGVDIPYTTELSRRDILDDEDTAKLGAVLYSAISYKKDGDETTTRTH